MFDAFPAMPFIDGTSRPTAYQLNEYRRRLAALIDAGSGGTVTPSVSLQFGGALIELASTDRLGVASRSIVRHQEMLASSASVNWTIRPGNVWRNTSSSGTLWIAIDSIPDGAVLDAVTLTWDGASGHPEDPVNGGASPIVMPRLDVYRYDVDGAGTLLGQQSDTTTTRALYEAAHSITVTGLAHTVDLTANRYMCQVVGETGAGFVANAEALSLQARFTVTEMPEW